MQKNVASQKIGAQMVSAADGSAFTGSVTVYVTGDAGTQAVGSVGSGACTHEGNGYHTYAPAQAETNYDLIAFTFIGTGAIPQTIQVETRVDANVTYAAGTAWNSGAIGASTLAADTITAAKIADAAIDSATFASGAINAAAIAADAITAAKVASDAVAEIQDGLATADSISALNDISSADVHSEVHDVLQDVGLNLHLSTISSLTSQTSFSIWTGSASDNAYNDCVAVIRDEDNPANLCVAKISDYTASGRVVTLGADPGVFTIAVGDSVAILPKDASVLASIAALNNLSAAESATAVRSELTTELGRLDAAVSTRLATAGYTAPPSAATIAAQITTDHGSGSYVRNTEPLDSTATQSAAAAALVAYDPPTRTEATSDKTEILSAVSAISGGAGEGARTVTITVTDGTDPIQNAKVRMTSGAESYVQDTDVDGEVVFSLDDATWSVGITKPLYSFTPTTLIVNGDETAEYEMDALSLPSAGSSLQTTAYLYTYDANGDIAPSTTVRFRLSSSSGTAGRAYDSTEITATSDQNGLLSVSLLKSTTYKAGIGSALTLFTTGSASTYAIPELVGIPSA